jgi:4-aminobutyrate aminotransferase-like enzyme
VLTEKLLASTDSAREITGQQPGPVRQPSGSDAIEATIKLAKYNTENNGLIAFRGAYHSGSAGALSLTVGNKYKKEYMPMRPDVQHVPYPAPFRTDRGPDAPSISQVFEYGVTLTYGRLIRGAGYLPRTALLNTE